MMPGDFLPDCNLGYAQPGNNQAQIVSKTEIPDFFTITEQPGSPLPGQPAGMRDHSAFPAGFLSKGGAHVG